MTRTQSKRNNRAAELVAAFERSGLTRKAFCKSMGIAVTTLDYYRRRVKVEPGGQVGLVAVERKPDGVKREPLVLVLRGGLRLEIGAGFDEATLCRIVGAVDMRKGFEGLYGLVRDELGRDPLSGHLFLFANRSRTRSKLWFWDGSGLW
ncbi:MAG: IS66 family insertion sequence element accessory protein TnpB, partial [Acidobacteriota bacterium]